MMWIILTVFGALMNIIRLAYQKHLNKEFSVAMVTWARFVFGLPIACAYFYLISRNYGVVPEIHKTFLFYALAVAVFQVLGTMFLVLLFRHRNFVTGVAYSKTEAIQTALIGIIFFGEILSVMGMVAVTIGAVGVVIISMEEVEGKRRFSMKGNRKSAVIGLASGFSFAIAGLSIRYAGLSLALPSATLAAATTLLTSMIIQTIILAVWIFIQNRHEFIKCLPKVKMLAMIGVTSCLGSVGLYTALTMAEAAYVKTVTQIGVLFSVMMTHRFFKEQISYTEMIGIALLVLSIMLVGYYH